MAPVFALGAIALWSTNAVFANFVLQTLPVEQVQFLQFLGATLVFALLYHRQKTPEDTTPLRTKLSLGIIGLTGTMVFQYIAFNIGPITEVNIIAYGWPLMAAVLLVVTGSTQNPWRLMVLSMLGFAGVVLLVGGTNVTSAFQTDNLGGVLAALLSALCMAVFSFGMTKTKCDGNSVLLPGALVGLALTAVWCLLGNPVWDSPIQVLCGLYLGAGPMGLGYLFWTIAMQRDSSGHVALLGFLTPFTSTLLLVAAGKTLTMVSLLGACLLLVASTIVSAQAWSNRHAQHQ